MKKWINRSLAMLVTILIMFSYVNATDIEQIQSEKENIDSQLFYAKSNKDAYEAQYNSENNELTYIINSQNWVMYELELNQDNINKLAGEIDNLSNSIMQTENEYNKKLEQLEGRFRVMYRNANVSKLEFLLESGSISEFFQRVRWLKRVFSKDKEVMADFENIKKDLAVKKGLLEIEKNDIQQTADSKRDEIIALSVNRSSVEERICITKSNLDYWAEMENKFAQKSIELEQTIRMLSGGGSYTGGNMAWPTPGCTYITQYYGTFIHPILGDYRDHFAIDIGAFYGSPIVASNSGTVINCGWIDGYGNTVIIDHGGGISTLYAHASSLATYNGAYVEKGSIIAYIGSTGMSTGPHLHFEVRVNGVCVNPLDYTSP